VRQAQREQQQYQPQQPTTIDGTAEPVNGKLAEMDLLAQPPPLE